MVKKIFGEQSDHAKQFDDITYGLPIFTDSTPKSAWQKAYENGLTKAEYTLNSFIDELDLFEPSHALGCPKCSSTDVFFLEIGEVGSKKYKLAVPQIAGAEWQTGTKVAYFNCKRCKSVFYSEPFKQA